MRAPRPSLARFALSCLYLGSIGFGGGVAVLANIRNRFVAHQKWLTDREFLHMSAVAQVLPGGASANTLTLIGNRIYGPAGAFVALATFIAPGLALTLLLSQVYGSIPHDGTVSYFFRGLNQAVVGLIAAFALRLVPEALKRGWQWVTAASAGFLSAALGFSAVEVLLACAGVGAIIDLVHKGARLRGIRRPSRRPAFRGESPEHLSSGVVPPLAIAGALGAAPLLAQLGGVFLKLGLAAYGGGFALVPTLHHEAVAVHHWLDDRAFADAVAVGQITPGPVLLTATFVGARVAGIAGAIVATIAIFAGPFVLAVVLGAGLERWRRRPVVRSLLRGLGPAVLGLMIAAGVILGEQAIRHAEGVGIALFTFVGVYRLRVNPALALGVGGLARVAIALFM